MKKRGAFCTVDIYEMEKDDLGSPMFEPTIRLIKKDCDYLCGILSSFNPMLHITSTEKTNMSNRICSDCLVCANSTSCTIIQKTFERCPVPSRMLSVCKHCKTGYKCPMVKNVNDKYVCSVELNSTRNFYMNQFQQCPWPSNQEKINK